MSIKHELIPKRRFKEFENADAWEQRKLGDITTFNKGKGYSKKDLVDNGTPIILYGRLYTDYQTLITKVDTFVAEVENSVISEGWEVIVPASGESAEDISRASVVAESGIILGGDLNIINKCSLLNPVFLALTISNGNQQKEMSKRAQGKSVVHLHNSDLKEINLVFPEIKEQSLIGEYFEKIDKLITIHQRKLSKLRILKSAYLSEIIPEEGKLNPKRRFSGFTEDWEKKKISDMFKVTRGQVLSMSLTSPIKDETNKYPVYSSQTKNDGLMGYYSEYLFDTSITWTTDGANAGTVNFRKGKFFSTNVNGVLLSNDGYCNKAVSEILNLVTYKYVSKVGNPKLMNNVMEEIIISVPKDKNEMKIISDFLMTFDKRIIYLEEKIKKLEDLKRSYLNEMFV